MSIYDCATYIEVELVLNRFHAIMDKLSEDDLRTVVETFGMVPATTKDGLINQIQIKLQ